MKTILILMVLLVSSIKSNSQVSQEWVTRYNDPQNVNDIARSQVIDGAGNIYITGSINSGSLRDYLTVKYNSNGILQWASSYNGPGNGDDYSQAIAVDSIGNVFVTGRSLSTGTGIDYATVKYNENGIQQWVARYNGMGNLNDLPTSIAIDLEGNLYVIGSSAESGTNYPITTIKYNSNGNQQWIAKYNGSGIFNEASEIVIDLLGNIYVTGYNSVDTTDTDFITIKYNPHGVEQWVTRYNGSANGIDVAKDIAIDLTGNVYISGISQRIDFSSEYITIKYNSNGIEQWVTRSNFSENSYCDVAAIALDNVGNVYVTGTNGLSDYATIKYNSNGVQQWVAEYIGTVKYFGDFPYGMVIDDLGNVYVTGYSSDSLSGLDYATIKYNSNGVEQWVERYNGPDNLSDGARGISIDGDRNIYVSGSSYGIVTQSDIVVIKYSQTTGIQNISSEIPEQFRISQNYPNPFNPTTKIKFDIKNSGNVKLVVYDMIGKEVVTLVNKNLNAGSYETDFDGGGLTSGVYFYKIETGDYSEVKKMTLLK